MSVKASSEPSVNAPLSTLPTAARNVLLPLALNAESCSSDIFSNKASAMPLATPVVTAFSIEPPFSITSFAPLTPAEVPSKVKPIAEPPGINLSITILIVESAIPIPAV